MTTDGKTQTRFDHVIGEIVCPICNAEAGQPCGTTDGKRNVHAGRVSIYYGAHREQNEAIYHPIVFAARR